MPPSDPELLLSSEQRDPPEQREVIDQGRGWLTSLVLMVGIAGLFYVVVTGGSDTDEQADNPAPTTSSPTTSSPATSSPTTLNTEVPLGPFAAPSVAGELIDGRPFSVTEPSPGVLCASIEGVETCHLELVTGSGPGVIDDALVFGYLTPGTQSATIRYRSIQPTSAGVRIEADARFFAIPLQSDDPYRLQYRNVDFEVDEEVPLVTPRGGPSQSADAAARDRVPAEIAALPFSQRVTVEAEWSAFAEGPMVWSTTAEPDLGPGVTERRWGELLLLDRTGTSIERATPLPGIRLTVQLAQPDTLYFLGEQVAGIEENTLLGRGEVTFPVALIRIDRETGDTLVRLFPQASTNEEPDIDPIADRDNWELGPPLAGLDRSTLGLVGEVVQLRTLDGDVIALDATSLLPIT